MLKVTPLCAIALLAMLFCLPLKAQFSKESFGKNRVQYQQFDWRYISTRNFDIFYYEGGYDLAVLAGKFAEEDINRITDVVGFSPYSKIKLYIYQSVSDMQQSNIGINQQGLEVGGQTSFVRSDVEVAFTGSKHDFRRELALGISDMLIFEMMYGGNLKELLQSSYLLNLPEWFMAGAARYIAEGWDGTMDNYMRDVVLQNKTRKPDKYTGEEATLIGQSIWNYIVEQYGVASISNIMNLTRIVRNEEASIENTFLISFNVFVEGWRNFYLKQAQEVLKDHALPNEALRLLDEDRSKRGQQVCISPDLKRIAFTQHERGKYWVKVYDIAEGSLKTLATGGFKVFNQKYDTGMPLIDWKDNATLAVIAAHKGKNALWLYDVNKGKRTQRHSFAAYSHVNSFDIAADGEMLVMSAEKETHSDIFTYHFQTKRFVSITKDAFDDASPSFLDENAIVFSSNRHSDTLKATLNSGRLLSGYFNIFIYEEGKELLKRVTNTYSNNLSPRVLNNERILFLSDQRGIAHLYSYDRKTGISQQMTNFAFNTEDFDLQSGTLIYSMLYNGRIGIYLQANIDASRNIFTNKTTRQQLKDLRLLEQLKKERQELKKAEQDSSGMKPQPEGEPKKDADTDSYQFDSFAKNKRSKFIGKFKTKGTIDPSAEVIQDVSFTKSEPYENLFTTDNFVTTLLIDPLRSIYGSGLGLMFEMQMTDLRENHKINGGLFGLTNLNNTSMFVQYEYLKRRIDYRLRFDMKNLEIANDFAFFQRYRMNTFELSGSYPINITSRVTIAPFFAQTRYLLGGSLNASSLYGTPDAVRQYAGARAEFVFDNTRITGMNMLSGTKFRASLEQYFGVNKQGIGFGNYNVELRNYQKIYRSLIFATRFSYGQFFGASRKYYILGGMDNWVGNAVDLKGGNDILSTTVEPNVVRDMSHLMFSKFVTSMRGFNYNKMSGNSHLLLNAELRLPLLRFFYKGTIASNFFRNLQLAAFTDMGAAWTGTSPFNRKNAVNTVTIPKQGGFSGSVTNFTNPFLIGYGFGARTMLLSYYMKFDVAWGIEGSTRNDAKFYLTFGYDF